MTNKKTTEKPDSSIADGCHIAEALMKIGNAITTLEPDGTGAYGKYLSLGKIRRESQGHLDRHGLSIMQLPETGEGGALAVRTIITHVASGEVIQTVFQLSPEALTMQSAGACLSYLRRYALGTILGIAPGTDGEDLDAMRDPSEADPPPLGSPVLPPQRRGIDEPLDDRTPVTLKQVGADDPGKKTVAFVASSGHEFNLFREDRNGNTNPNVARAQRAVETGDPVWLEMKVSKNRRRDGGLFFNVYSVIPTDGHVDPDAIPGGVDDGIPF
jgi:hypothetical protein